ncbi:hypothetical protein [Palleronia sp. THAF1]|uniref:hypothetical protein n=1 Tax=Palleronia sp. THAF1 TaxID=2587842 RepID=UPI000F51B0FD|nr:hypothetical protein [Palleronia sp. THAF1]
MLGLTLCVVLVACGQLELSSTSTRSERIETTQYRMMPAGRAWLYVPGGLLTLERDLGHVQEQRIALPNQTTMDGDNLMLLRTRKAQGRSRGRLKLETFLSESGGLPAPFETAKHGQMQIAEDALGPYFFLSKAMGPGVTCVLAIRPIAGSSRMLPNGADAVDVMLRNCVPGDQMQALEPIKAAALGRAVGVTADGGQAPLHTQSPFAAPGAAVR